MTAHYDKARTVICPVCEAAAGESCRYTSAVRAGEVMAFPHPDRVELVFPGAKSERRLVSLTCSAPANSRDPRRFTLLVEDEEANTVMAFDMDEHQFCLLMSHHVVNLEVS